MSNTVSKVVPIHMLSAMLVTFKSMGRRHILKTKTEKSNNLGTISVSAECSRGGMPVVYVLYYHCMKEHSS